MNDRIQHELIIPTKVVKGLTRLPLDLNYPVGVIAIDPSTKKTGISGFCLERDGGSWFLSSHACLSEDQLPDIEFDRRSAILDAIDESLTTRPWNSIMVTEGLYMGMNVKTLVTLSQAVASWRVVMLQRQGYVVKTPIPAMSWRARYLQPDNKNKSLAAHGLTTSQRKNLSKVVAKQLGADVRSDDEAEAWLLGLHVTIALQGMLSKV